MKIVGSSFWKEIKAPLRKNEYDIFVFEYPVRAQNKDKETVDSWYSYVFFQDKGVMKKVALELRWQEALPWRDYNILFVPKDAGLCLEQLKKSYPDAEINDLDAEEEELPLAASGD